ncbi:MAG: pantoate--beta-alanine ligase [Candidatus Syntrophosphaera sp.]
MQVFRSISDIRAKLAELPEEQELGLVPTMGYFHEGHLSLVERSKSNCDKTVVSIFVNPAQFGPQEDLENYPRDIERDLEMLRNHNVDYVFIPDKSEMYPPDYKTWVEVTGLSDILCGASRPGHFRGVATIVLKLVNIIKPDKLFLGLKDYQQIVVLDKMLKDLNVETSLERCPIIREEDGLAMSSRNIYLSNGERQRALCLQKSINQAKRMVQSGVTDVGVILDSVKKIIHDAKGRIDYVSIVDADTLKELKRVTSNARILLAVFIGNTRLIDNSELIS